MPVVIFNKAQIIDFIDRLWRLIRSRQVVKYTIWIAKVERFYRRRAFDNNEALNGLKYFMIRVNMPTHKKNKNACVDG